MYTYITCLVERTPLLPGRISGKSPSPPLCMYIEIGSCGRTAICPSLQMPKPSEAKWRSDPSRSEAAKPSEAVKRS